MVDYRLSRASLSSGIGGRFPRLSRPPRRRGGARMAFRTRETRCVTRLIPLHHLTRRQRAQCEELRREAGRCWASLVTAHREEREAGHWMSTRELELHVVRGYALHSQTVQALAQRLDANLQTVRILRENKAGEEGGAYAYPYRTPEFQTVIWKDMAIRRVGERLILSNGRGREPLQVRLPAEYQAADIRRAELTWRADHFELCLILDTGETLPELNAGGALAGVDLGEIHIAAVATSAGNVLILPGRHLRACKRLRNKRHAAYRHRLAQCVEGSRRWRRLRRRAAQASARFYRQQRDILHQASRKALTFCSREGVGALVVGDVRGIQRRLRRGANNQRLGQWAQGHFCRYLAEKAAVRGISVAYLPEDYSSLTCSRCGQERPSPPTGRDFACPACGANIHRDANGAANICSRGLAGAYGVVAVASVRFARPIRAGGRVIA